MMILARLILLVAVLGKATQVSTEEPGKVNLRGSGTAAAHESEHDEDERALAFGKSNATGPSPHTIVGGTIATARPWFVEANGYV
jgi:hypothetical protein